MDFCDVYTPAARLQLADAGIDRDLAEDEALDDEGAGPLVRADLVFYGVRHSRGSFEARVFFGNPAADAATPKDPGAGFAGSFWVFAHDHCYGDAGHCDPTWGEADDAFDYRPAHKMEPHTRSVQITEALRRRGASAEPLTLTVVAVRVAGPVPDDRPPLRFDEVRLLTYG